jgi:hypothetical protein
MLLGKFEPVEIGLVPTKRCVLVPESTKNSQASVDVQHTALREPSGEAPLTELSMPEMLVLRRWLRAALQDMIMQIELAAKDRRISKRDFLRRKQAAEHVTAWLVSALTTCDGMLTVTVEEPTTTEESES